MKRSMRLRSMAVMLVSEQGGRVYHEKIGGGPIIGPETWPIINNLVRTA